MADENALVYEFRAQLLAFGEDVEGKATATLQETAQVTAEAVVIGNEYGPGIAVDTGFARSSFRLGVGAPEDGPSARPFISRRVTRPGTEVFREPFNLAKAAQIRLGVPVFITTVADYPQYLEFEPKRRRYGKNAGASTVFLEPVEVRFERLVDDCARRVGYDR